MNIDVGGRVLWSLFGSKGEDVRWGKLHKEELKNFDSSPNYVKAIQSWKRQTRHVHACER